MICSQVFSSLEWHGQEMCRPIAEGVLSCARWCRVGVNTVEHAMGVVAGEGSSAVVEMLMSDASARWPLAFVQRVRRDRECSVWAKVSAAQ